MARFANRQVGSSDARQRLERKVLYRTLSQKGVHTFTKELLAIK
jgi:hypothetical protein